MPYANPIKTYNRALSPNVLISSAPFSALGLHVGARMSLFNYNDQIIVYSAIPYSDAFVNSLKELTGKSDKFKISHIIIPNSEHNVGGELLREKFPDAKFIAGETYNPDFKVDYKIPDAMGNKVLGPEELKQLGIKDEAILENLNFVYLNHRTNKEVVVYDKNIKTLFCADLLMGFHKHGFNEAYNEKTGWSSSPYSGLTLFFSWFNELGWLWRKFISKSAKVNTPEGIAGVKTVYGLDFKNIVGSHGNVVENAKSVYETYFPFVKE